MLEMLKSAESGSFDQAYMSQDGEAHEKTVQLIKSEIDRGAGSGSTGLRGAALADGREAPARGARDRGPGIGLLGRDAEDL